MSTEIIRADQRLRRVTAIVLVLAVLAAIALVLALNEWMSHLAATLPTERLIVEIRRWIGFSMIASAMCLLLLAGYAARLARRTAKERRWPLGDARVLRDTPLRRDQAALRIAQLLDIVAFVLVLFGVATAMLSWRLFAVVN